MGMNSEHLIWIDLEMTGLRTDSDQIIEIATVVTDKDLNIIAEGPEFAIHQPDEVLARMDAWNQRQHGNSGLVSRVRSSSMTLAEAEPRAQRQLVAVCERSMTSLQTVGAGNPAVPAHRPPVPASDVPVTSGRSPSSLWCARHDGGARRARCGSVDPRLRQSRSTRRRS